MEPIKTQTEANKVREYLIKTICKTLNIDKEEAGKRVDGLFKSGILEQGNPNDNLTKIKIDAFLQIPSNKYAHLK